jgi:hypothetical protein
MNYIYYHSFLLTNCFFRLFANIKYKDVPIARAMAYSFHREAIKYFSTHRVPPNKNWPQNKSKLYSMLIESEPVKHIQYSPDVNATQKIIYSPYAFEGLNIDKEQSIICGQNRSEKKRLRGLEVPFCIPQEMSPLNKKSYQSLVRQIKGILKRKKIQRYFKRKTFITWMTRQLNPILRIIDGIDTLFSRNHVAGIVQHSSVHPLGYLLVHMGKQRGIPTINLQYGLNDDYQLLSTYVDHYIAWGTHHKQRLTQFGVPESKFNLLGNARFDPIFTGKWKEEKQLRGILNFSNKKLIFVYPEQPLKESHNKKAMTTILNALEPYRDKLVLLVKEHPNQKKSTLTSTDLRKYPFVRRVTNPHIHLYDLLNSADAVFVQFSTVGIEAILFNKLMISLSLFPNTDKHEYSYYSASKSITSARNQKQLSSIIKQFFATRSYRRKRLRAQQKYRKGSYNGTLSATRIQTFIQNKSLPDTN